jgi:cell division protein FtsL
MEKKERTSIIVLAVSIASFLGCIVCGFAFLSLRQGLIAQRKEANQTRSQLSALNQALKNQELELSQTRAQLSSASNQIAAAQTQNQTLSRQVAELKSRPLVNRTAAAMPAALFQFPQDQGAPDVAAADSVEGKLRAEGKHWERTEGEPVPGGYVLDTLRGRMDQPKGRGSIGKVLAVGVNDDGRPGATVDFGRGFTTGIMFTELSPVRLFGPELR